MDERLTEIPTATLIVAAALVGPDGQVLMQLRQKRAMHGGLWEFPGGKVEPGEPPEAALRREIHEELGLDISESELVPVGFAADQAPPVPGGRLHVILLYMVCRWVGEPASLDAQQIAWLSPRALSDLAMPPLDYPLAEQLLNFLPKN